jgi:CubicO group peptidase (beta-lactamase class C family)
MSLNNMAFAKSNSANANSAPYKAVKEKMTEIIKQEMENLNAVGLSIVLVDDQQIVWERGFGYQDREKKLPATENTIYQVGSITKLFTVLAAMQLAAQGKLDIDQPLQKYLPDFSIQSRFASNQPITARTIMTHHSGIPSDHLNGYMSKPYSSLVKDLQNEYVAFPPNYIHSYSNIAFTLLGHTVAMVSKKDYPDYIQDELLRPIGMQHSFIADFPSVENPLMSKIYLNGKEDKPISERDIPAGGLYANVKDMARFMQMIIAGGSINGQRIINSETLVETMRPQNENIPLDLDFRIGLGWFLSEVVPGYNGKVVEHAGIYNHFNSELIILPEAKLGVVVLGNYEELVGQVRKIAKKTLELAWEEKSKRKIPIYKDSIIAPPNIPSSSDLHNYVGYYSIMGEIGQIDHENDRFFLKTKDDDAFYLDKNNDGSYSIKNGPKFFFRTIDGWDLIIMQSFVRILFATKITPLPLSAGSDSLCGGYKIIVNHIDLPSDMDDIIIVKIKDGFLTMAYKDYEHPDYNRPKVLRAVSATEWVIDGLGRDIGNTIIFKMVNGEQYLAYSGLQYKKIEDFIGINGI